MYMVIEKYKNDGWGISLEGFRQIYKLLQAGFNVVEFGSGISTIFFEDYKDINVISFENDPDYLPDVSKVCVKYRPLVHCSDDDYERMFINKELAEMKPYPLKPSTRQRNCFYDIRAGDLPEKVDFVLLDGPNGNGRNIAFIHLKDKLHRGAVVFIDDYNHYDFVQIFGLFFKYEILYKHDSIGDVFIILQVK